MQHQRRIRIFRRGWVFSGSLAALLAGGGCGDDARVIEPGPTPSEPSSVDSAPIPNGGENNSPTPADVPGEVMPAPGEPPAVVPVDACPSEGACLPASTVPCTLHCEVRADGCVASAELVPLGTGQGKY